MISILGYVNQIDAIYENGQYNLHADLYHNAHSSLERGIHWIYTVLDIPFLYDLKIVYHKNPDILMDEMLAFEKVNYELGVWESTNNALYWSVILDKRTNVILYHNPFVNDWFRYFIACETSAFYRVYHPEVNYINESIISSIVLPFTSAFFFVMKDQIMYENHHSPHFLIINMLLNIYCVALFLVFFFSYFNNSSRDENIVDQDFMVAAMTVEAEEEIASIDDMSMSLFILIFIFSWFFYANCIFILTNIPEISVLYYNIPFLYYMIFLIPTLLLYDFGIFFVAYLRGASSTASFAMELLYDYIAVATFYTRLLVQNVRLLLMTLVYFSLYECILAFVTLTTWFGNYETLWETKANNHTNYSSYYFLIKIPGQLIYWVYELLHTFFVVTAQFVAFFAMIFWLFLFLFTMFVFEQQERYLSEKRELRKENVKLITTI